MQGAAISVLQLSLYDTLFILTPIIGVTLLVGLIISVFQALTQVNDPTLPFVAKIISTFLVLIFLGNLFLKKLMALTVKIFDSLPFLLESLK